MSKLLRAGIYRYRTSRLFWAAMVGSIVLGMMYGSGVEETMIFVPFQFIITSIMISMFIGAQHSDGGFRNKIVAGYTKTQIVVAELILNTGLSVMLYLIHSISYAVLHVEMLQKFPKNVMIHIFFNCLCLSVFVAVVHTVCSCLISSKTKAGVINVVLFVMMLFVGFELIDALNEGKIFEMERTTTSGEVIYYEEPNPNYVGGTKRKIYQAIYDSLPYFQVDYYLYDIIDEFDQWWGTHDTDEEMRLTKSEQRTLNRHTMYSLGLTVVIASTGIIIFRKTDLK